MPEIMEPTRLRKLSIDLWTRSFAVVQRQDAPPH